MPKKKKKHQHGMTPKQAARYIENNLIKEGVVLQVYQSRTSKSIYIKLDCGLANTIRISDHKGYGHLHYLVNIDTTHTGKCLVKKEDGYTQYVYSSTRKELNKVVKHLLAHRQRKMEAAGGSSAYRQQMKRAYVYHKDSKGFWQFAKFKSQKLSRQLSEATTTKGDPS